MSAELGARLATPRISRSASRSSPSCTKESAAFALAYTAPSSREVVLALKDLWAGADVLGRGAIVEAWAAPAALKAGGALQLARITQGEPSTLAVLAAAKLYGAGAGLVKDAERERAVGVLQRAVNDGTTAARVLAIHAAGLDRAELLEAVREASKQDADGVVAVAAWSRLAGLDASRAEALEQLLKLAKQDGVTGSGARMALSRAGEAKVLGLLAQDADSASRLQRSQAAQSFALLGAAAKAAALLADADGGVRSAAACAITQMP